MFRSDELTWGDYNGGFIIAYRASSSESHVFQLQINENGMADNFNVINLLTDETITYSGNTVTISYFTQPGTYTWYLIKA